MKRANRTIANADHAVREGDEVEDTHPLALRRPAAFDVVADDGRTLAGHTVAELRDLAEDLDVEVPSGALKDELIDALEAATTADEVTPLVE